MIDTTLPPEPTATPAPTPYAPDGEITDSLLDFFKADSFDVYRQTVRNGDKGTEVERVQRRLHQLKYLYSADGTFGNLTENALKYFQRKNNLDQTGVADESTQRLLFSPNAIESEGVRVPLQAGGGPLRPPHLRLSLDGRRLQRAYRHLQVLRGRAKTPTPQGTFRAPARLAGDGTTSRTSTVTPSTPGAYRAAYSSTRLHTAGPNEEFRRLHLESGPRRIARLRGA